MAERADRARDRVRYQYEPALYEEMTEREIAQQRRLHTWARSKQRRQHKRMVRWELAEDRRTRKAAAKSRRQDVQEKHWHAEALAARRRATSPDATVGRLHRRMTLMSRHLRAAMIIPFFWSALNVGRNLVPDHSGPGGVTWWALWIASFTIEAMISVPVLEIMRLSTTAAESGHQTERGKIILIEGGLLLVSVGLNAGPHLAADDWGRAAEYAVAPVMVVVGMWVHSWLASRYAILIEDLLSRGKPPNMDRPIDADEAAAVGIDDMSTVMMRAQPVNRPSHPITVSGPATGWGLGAAQTPSASTVRDDLPAPSTAVHGADHPIRTVLSMSGLSGLAPTAGAAVGGSTEVGPETVAHTMVLRRESKFPESDLVDILRAAERGENPNAIAARLSAARDSAVPRSTVARLILRATALGLRVPDAHGEVVSRSA